MRCVEPARVHEANGSGETCGAQCGEVVDGGQEDCTACGGNDGVVDELKVSFAALGGLGNRIASRDCSDWARRRASRWAVSWAAVRMLTVLGLISRLARGEARVVAAKSMRRGRGERIVRIGLGASCWLKVFVGEQ